MATQIDQNVETQIVRETRKAQGMTLREFGPELGVSFQVVQFWETGSQRPGNDRISAWMLDPKPWVKQMALRLFMARNGDALSRLAAEPALPQEKQS